MVMTWAAVVYATLTLLYWFCDSGYNYNWVLFFVLWTYAPVVSYQIRRWWSRVAPLWSRVVARSDLKKWFITRSKLDEFRIKRWCSVSSVQGIVLDSFGTKLTPMKILFLDLTIFFLLKVSESITGSITGSKLVND